MYAKIRASATRRYQKKRRWGYEGTFTDPRFNNMDCSAARHLLDQGVTPGSTTAERAALGFHLASCGECRAYRTATEQDLLAELLFQAARPAHPPARPNRVPPPPAPPPPVRAPRHWRALIGQTLWYAGIGSLALIVLLTIGTLGWIALAGLGIHRNVQAMIIPTEVATSPPSRPPTQTSAPTPTHTPLPQVVSTPALARPSTTPLPTVPPPTATPSAPAAGAPVTVLLLGSDQRPGETGAARTDAVMIARIDPEKRRIALL